MIQRVEAVLTRPYRCIIDHPAHHSDTIKW